MKSDVRLGRHLNLAKKAAQGKCAGDGVRRLQDLAVTEVVAITSQATLSNNLQNTILTLNNLGMIAHYRHVQERYRGLRQP